MIWYKLSAWVQSNFLVIGGFEGLKAELCVKYDVKTDVNPFYSTLEELKKNALLASQVWNIFKPKY